MFAIRQTLYIFRYAQNSIYAHFFRIRYGYAPLLPKGHIELQGNISSRGYIK